MIQSKPLSIQHPVTDRIFGLDLMRAVAILVVMYMHGMFLLPESTHRYYNLPLPAIDGVSIFFVLSGFLIGGILLRTLEKPTFSLPEIGEFWIRRWFRTLPNYLLVLTLVLVASLLLGETTGDFYWGYYFFVQNLFTKHPEFFSEAWSLSVEEWFYLLLPVLVFGGTFLVRNRKHALLLVALAILIVPFVLRVQHFSLYGIDPKLPVNMRKIVVFRLDSLMYGVLTAYVFRYQREWCIRYRKVGLFLSLAMIVAMTLNMRLLTNGPMFRSIWLPSLEPISAMLALPFLASWNTTKFAYLARPVQFISTISYSMYLLNLTFVQHTVLPLLTGEVSWIHPPTLKLGILRYVLYWVLTILFSWCLYRYFENPMRNLRDKISFTNRGSRELSKSKMEAETPISNS
jgi:peptidoglycan/LPS O-acetylase OafA/YrhL